ncbi:sigma-54-dependent transcriptional regulator [Desulfococcus sp.]|jgi:DNA-binding NtrC family response regulator|nr:two component system response regulator, sigma54-specific [Desulfococcus multivorans]
MGDRILFVEDEPEMLQFLARYFSRRGYAVTAAASGEEAWRLLSQTTYDLVVCDQALDGISGLDLLRMIRETDRDLPFIMITGAGTIETAVEAIKIGAFHYVTKPFKPGELAILASRAVEFGKLHRKLSRIHADEDEADRSIVIGNNRRILEMMQTIEKISGSDAPVLIQGETGTGKSVFARRIHETSRRRGRPFVTIDCGALPENLIESELFGHVKGAFTGAVRPKRGLLEEADGGTIFLDEIGEMTAATQTKLLRALQDLVIKPVGGNQIVAIDVRYISATNKDLHQEVAAGRFREDLYYRLAVIPLYLPPLRERREDIIPFVRNFVRELNRRYGKRVSKVDPLVLQSFMEAPWKGNIRELKNVLERSVLLAEGAAITADCLSPSPAGRGVADRVPKHPVSLKTAVEAAERQTIRSALAAASGNRSKAAEILGIGRRTLYAKMAAYGIE